MRGRRSRRALLVAGGTSYIGRWVTREAERLGHAVTSVGSTECNFLDAREVAALLERLSTWPLTVLFLAVINKPVENSYRAYQDNVEMVRSLITAASRADVRSVIYFSSVDVYGRQPHRPTTESSPIDPDSWYGLAKYSGEWMLRASGDLHCPVTVLRLPGVFGCGARDRSVIGRMVASARDERRIVVYGTGKVLRDYVYVGDVARLVAALTPIEHDGVLNVATGVSYSINEIARRVRDVLGVKAAIVHAPEQAERAFDLTFDASALAAVLPKFRFASLTTGIQSYL